MQIHLSDVFTVRKNQRGVYYLRDIISRRIVAKNCTKCGTFKFLNDFNKAGKGFAGTHSLCRVCHKSAGVTYRAETKRFADIEHKRAEQAHALEQELEQHYAQRREAHRVKRSVIF